MLLNLLIILKMMAVKLLRRGDAITTNHLRMMSTSSEIKESRDELH